MWVGMTTMIVVERSVRAAPGNAFQTPASHLSLALPTLFAPVGAASVNGKGLTGDGVKGAGGVVDRSRNGQYLP